MIQIIDKHNCCGCSACAQRCPRKCIVMRENEEGFLYPFVYEDQCVQCDVCESVCPCLNENDVHLPTEVMAVVNDDIIVRKQSSSGGAFSMLADFVLEKKGVVFGARFTDKWEVEHDYIETKEDLCILRGSKYVQSYIGESFIQVEKFLKMGRVVLFSGTPCQILGLRLFLRREYSNLLLVSIACHSVPSPLVWREYLKGKNLCQITDVNFRNKRDNWEHYSMCIRYKDNSEFYQEHIYNPYMLLFLHGIISRKSCFNCKAKNGKCGADITIGDCWGVSKLLPQFSNDHFGVSVVLSYTSKGDSVLKQAGIKGEKLRYEQLIEFNGGLTNCLQLSKYRTNFWKSFLLNDQGWLIIDSFAKIFQPGFFVRLKLFISRFFLFR